MNEGEEYLGVGEVEDTMSTKTEQNLLPGNEVGGYETNSEDRKSTVIEEPSIDNTTYNSPTSSTREPETSNLIKTNETIIEGVSKIEIVSVNLANGFKGRLKRSNSRIETDLSNLSFLEKPTPKITIQEIIEDKELENIKNEKEEEEEVQEEKEEEDENKKEVEKQKQTVEDDNINNSNEENQIKIEEKPKSAEEILKKKEKTNDQIIFVNDRARTKKQWWFWPSNYIR